MKTVNEKDLFYTRNTYDIPFEEITKWLASSLSKPGKVRLLPYTGTPEDMAGWINSLRTGLAYKVRQGILKPPAGCTISVRKVKNEESELVGVCWRKK